MRIHLGKKDHKCPHCDYSSVRKDNLKSHMKTHDKINDQSTTRKRTTPSSGLPNYVNYQQITFPRMTATGQSTKVITGGPIRKSLYNLETLKRNFGLNSTSIEFDPSMQQCLQGKILPGQSKFSYDQMAPPTKQRRYEDVTKNRNSAKITDVTEQQFSCGTETNRKLKVKSANEQQNVSTETRKRNEKHVNLFRPYEDLVTKNTNI